MYTRHKRYSDIAHASGHFFSCYCVLSLLEQTFVVHHPRVTHWQLNYALLLGKDFEDPYLGDKVLLEISLFTTVSLMTCVTIGRLVVV